MPALGDPKDDLSLSSGSQAARKLGVIVGIPIFRGVLTTSTTAALVNTAVADTVNGVGMTFPKTNIQTLAITLTNMNATDAILLDFGTPSTTNFQFKIVATALTVVGTITLYMDAANINALSCIAVANTPAMRVTIWGLSNL